LKGFVINGTENALLPKVKIFPQPASTEVWIDAEQDYSAQLLDLQGRKHRDIQVSKGYTSIDRQDLPAGIYFLRCFDRTGNAAGVKKLIFAD
jgi:hypothetical protein